MFVVSEDSMAVFQPYQNNDSLTFVSAFDLQNIGSMTGENYLDIDFSDNGKSFYLVNHTNNSIIVLENQYYNEELNSVVKNYIVPWVTTSNMYKLFSA